MSAAQSKTSDPSMEEILASIRRIISDDQGAKASASPAETADEEVMELTPKSSGRKAPEPHYVSDDPVDNDVAFGDPASEPSGQDDIDALMASFGDEAPTEPAKSVPAPFHPPEPSNDRLLSTKADRAVASSFASLTNAVLSKNARTVDSLIEDMMRPMVKDWLDENLPVIVERLVKAEIERVARGGR